MSVFSAADYKSFLVEFINKNQRRGLLTEMAKAIGCAHSYLSQVLNGKPDLTPDQSLAAAAYMALSEDEGDYFLDLVFHDRAATPALKVHFQKRLVERKRKHLEVSARVKKAADARLSLAGQERYYASTLPMEIHLLTACHDYQTADALAEKLSLPPARVKRELETLIENGLVIEKARRYLHSGKNLHLDPKSPFNRVNHLNWRLKATQQSAEPDDVHYTSAFAVSRAAWPKLKEGLLKFIEQQRAEIGASGSEEAYVFCCDLFGIG